MRLHRKPFGERTLTHKFPDGSHSKLSHGYVKLRVFTLFLTIAWMIIMLLVFLIFFYIYKNVSNHLARTSTQTRIILSKH